MARELDEIDRKLLERLQVDVPLVSAPFEAIGKELGLGEQVVINRIKALKQAPNAVIRQISAIFDSQTLGYKSCLVAAKIEPSRLEEAAAVISKHAGVSHNYKREHDYNLWYTLAVPPDSELGLDRTIEILKAQSGALAMRKLQTIKLFKIGVNLNLSGEAKRRSPSAAPVRHASTPARVGAGDKVLIRILQRDLPIVARPFELWAKEAGVSEEQLLAEAKRFIEIKWMRRFAAVLHHREAGFDANAMGVWVVDEKSQEAFGQASAGFAEVSHCYLRPTYEDWPYNIFTMVHAQSREECEAVLKRISEATGVKEYRALYSTREFKKVRVRYFLDDIPDWERQAAARSIATAAG